MKKSLIGKMIKEKMNRFEQAIKEIRLKFGNAYDKQIEKIKKGLEDSKVSTVKFGALVLTMAVLLPSLTGCIFNFNNKKVDTDITPDKLVTEVGASDNEKDEGPVQGNADKDELPLHSNIPSLDTDSKEPELGVVDGDEPSVKDEGTLKDEEDLNSGNKTEDKNQTVSSSESNKIIKTLKNAINEELKTYFKNTKTVEDGQFSVSEVLYVQASGKGLEIGFTTNFGKTGGYSVITVGNANDSAQVKTLTGEYTSKAYLATMNAVALEDLVSITANAVKDSGISKNINSQYLVPVSDETSDLGNVVIAYYTSFNPNSENCKKVADGYEYTANVLIQNTNGMRTETVTVFSASRLSKNQYYDAIDEAIKDLLEEKSLGL